MKPQTRSFLVIGIECIGQAQNSFALLHDQSGVFDRELDPDFVVRFDPEGATLIEHVAHALELPVTAVGERGDEIPVNPLRLGRKPDALGDGKATVVGSVVGAVRRVPLVDLRIACPKAFAASSSNFGVTGIHHGSDEHRNELQAGIPHQIRPSHNSIG